MSRYLQGSLFADLDSIMHPRYVRITKRPDFVDLETLVCLCTIEEIINKVLKF